MSNYIFNQPNSPQEFGVVLASPELRNLDFSALDYTNLRRACIEYIRTYYPNDFNDFVQNNGVIMMVELLAYIGGNLAKRSDILVDSAYLPTSQTKDAVSQHLSLINQKIRRATPAIVDVEISVDNPSVTEIKIPPGTRFSISGPDNKSLYFEIYRSPGDFLSSISIPPGKRGVIAYGIEGFTANPLVVVSDGKMNQFIDITDAAILDDPIRVNLITTTDDTTITNEWTRIEFIESADSTDEVYEVKYIGDTARIIFGDNINGKAPIAGQTISVTYRLGGGIRGRIGANIINQTVNINPEAPTTAAIEVLFRNPTPSIGGTDEETIDQAKRRAPREFATHSSIVGAEDYAFLSANYSHPVYGSVAKAVAVLRSGVDQNLEGVVEQIRNASSVEDGVEILKNNYVNRNIIEVYVLAYGPDSTLVSPNQGLITGLKTYLSDINVFTDEVRIYSGSTKEVDLEANIILSRSVDPGTVKTAVNNEINKFFDVNNLDMGTGLSISTLYTLIQNVPGVRSVHIFKPADDIIETQKVTTDPNGIKFNEILVLKSSNLRFYFEPGAFKVPSISQ